MPRPGLLGSYIPCWVLLRSRAPWRMLLCLMYRGLGGADLGSNWVYPRCTTAPVHHLIPNKQMGVLPSSKTGASGCGRRTVKRPQAGKKVKEEAVVPTLTLTSTSTTLVSTLTPRRKERIKGMKQRDKVMLTGEKRFSSCMRRDRSLLDKPNVSERNVIRSEFSISFKSPFHHLPKEISLKLQIFFFIMEQSRSCESGWRH